MQGNKKTKTRIYKNLTNEDTTEETKGGKPNECFWCDWNILKCLSKDEEGDFKTSQEFISFKCLFRGNVMKD